MCRQYCRPPLDYESIAVDIFLEALNHGKFPVDIARIRSRCIDALRRRKLELSYLKGCIKTAESQQSDNSSAIRDSVCDQVNSILEKAHLTRVEATVVFLKFYKGLSYKQVGEQLGLTTNEVVRICKKTIERLQCLGLGQSE